VWPTTGAVSAAPDQALQVVVAQPGGQHAAVHRLGERRADAQAHGLEPVAVEVELRQVLAEGLAQAVVAVGALGLRGVDGLALGVEAGDVVRAGEHDAPHAVHAGRLVDMVGADDVGREHILEAVFGGHAAQVHHRLHALQQRHHRGLVLQRCRVDLLADRRRPRSTMSLTRSTSQRAFSRGRSTRPRPPAAPVSSRR
jgi:hypothetical protein